MPTKPVFAETVGDLMKVLDKLVTENAEILDWKWDAPGLTVSLGPDPTNKPQIIVIPGKERS